jgi:hypothetical protein
VQNYNLTVFTKYLFCRDENVRENEAALKRSARYVEGNRMSACCSSGVTADTCSIPAVFAGFRTILTEPSVSLLGAETMIQSFSTQLLIVLKSGNSAYLRRPKFRCITIIFLNGPMFNAQWAPELIHLLPAEGFVAFTLIL